MGRGTQDLGVTSSGRWTEGPEVPPSSPVDFPGASSKPVPVREQIKDESYREDSALASGGNTGGDRAPGSRVTQASDEEKYDSMEGQQKTAAGAGGRTSVGDSPKMVRHASMTSTRRSFLSFASAQSNRSADGNGDGLDEPRGSSGTGIGGGSGSDGDLDEFFDAVTPEEDMEGTFEQ